MNARARINRWCRVAPALGLGLVALAWAAPATAQDNAERLVLRGVAADDTDNVHLLVSYSGNEDDLDGLAARENGHDVDLSIGSLADAGIDQRIAFLFDTSATTDGNALLAEATDAVEALLPSLPPEIEVGIVTAGGASQLLERPTTDQTLLTEAIDELTPAGEGAVLSGIVRASNVVERADTLTAVVLFTDGVENSGTSLEVARGALLDGGTALYVVGLQDGKLDEGAFGSLANDTGGRMLVTDDASRVADMLDELKPEFAEPRAATYASSEGVGVQDVLLAIGNARAEGSYISGSTLLGVNRVVDRPEVTPSGVHFFQTDTGKMLGFGAALLACVMFAYGVFLLFIKEKTALSQALQPYSDGYLAEPEDGEGDGAFATTAILQRAVALTEQIAKRQGVLTTLERKLEKADLPLRAAEALFFYVAAVVLVLMASLALTGNLMGTLITTVLIALLPPAVLNFLANRKKKQFEALLPDTLQLLSSTLRAGYSMMQGVEAVSVEAAEPMGKELRRVVTEARLGRPLEESLEAVAERMESADFAWAVMAIRIQREVGGNLSELLMTVAETMTERERLRRDINSLTAEGRISAYVLIGLPIGLGGFLYVINPEYVGKLFDVTLGQIMLGGAVLGIGVGYAWMMKIIKIEI